MGCCVSAGKRNHEAENRRSIDGEAPTSPRGSLEVETVKEVLLETAVSPKPDEKIKIMSQENQEWKAEVRPTAAIAGNRDVPGKDGGETASEVTSVSEICNYSESLSTTATMERGAELDESVVDQRPPPRKRRAHGGGRGERVAAPTPEKRGQVSPMRTVRGRAVAAQPRNVAQENGIGNGRRKDLADGSGTRPRSPARREELAAAAQKESDQKTPAAAEATKGVIPAGETETLENPLVSLECFIFL